jgi:hypothetical protein
VKVLERFGTLVQFVKAFPARTIQQSFEVWKEASPHEDARTWPAQAGSGGLSYPIRGAWPEPDDRDAHVLTLLVCMSRDILAR